ncbi:hypothetical protein BV20DRAFT_982664 [Pilatotrama ljubarskyi]|nr:hypothetical protein BV20DRAFT_982664 [Pilatotrama ljubarskyi]
MATFSCPKRVFAKLGRHSMRTPPEGLPIARQCKADLKRRYEVPQQIRKAADGGVPHVWRLPWTSKQQGDQINLWNRTTIRLSFRSMSDSTLQDAGRESHGSSPSPSPFSLTFQFLRGQSVWAYVVISLSPRIALIAEGLLDFLARTIDYLRRDPAERLTKRVLLLAVIILVAVQQALFIAIACRVVLNSSDPDDAEMTRVEGRLPSWVAAFCGFGSLHSLIRTLSEVFNLTARPDRELNKSSHSISVGRFQNTDARPFSITLTLLHAVSNAFNMAIMYHIRRRSTCISSQVHIDHAFVFCISPWIVLIRSFSQRMSSHYIAFLQAVQSYRPRPEQREVSISPSIPAFARPPENIELSPRDAEPWKTQRDMRASTWATSLRMPSGFGHSDGTYVPQKVKQTWARAY